MSNFSEPSAGAASGELLAAAAGGAAQLEPPPTPELLDSSSPPQPASASSEDGGEGREGAGHGVSSQSLACRTSVAARAGAAHDADRVVLAAAGGGVEDDVSAAV